jgi:hypothetical protein
VRPDEEALPPLFAGWMAALLPGPIPAEKAATCDRCAMLRPDDPENAPRATFFSPKTKCCTYLPELANFLVGRVLADETPEAAYGRATVEARIDKGLGVTPLGLQKTPLYVMLYRTSPDSFGHAASMRCPHFVVDGGRCGVWRHRESTCATWFCKYARGEVGRMFWQRLHDVLAAVEEAVRIHCLVVIGIDAQVLATLHPTRAVANAVSRGQGLAAADVEKEVDPARQRAVWGAWHGRERELYGRCAQIADALSWQDVLELGGARLDLLSRLLLDAYGRLVSNEVPAHARHRSLKVIYSSADSAEVVGYSTIDALRMPRRLVDVLHHFDGRPTQEVLESIEEEEGVRIAPGTVRKLADFGVLSDEPGTTAP